MSGDDNAEQLRASAQWIQEMEHESWFGTAELQREAADEIERLRAERDTERALADQLADALRWQADPYQKGTLMMSHRALDAYEKIRRG